MFLGYNYQIIMLKGLAILALAFYVLPVQTYAQTNKTKQATEGDNPSPAVAPIIPKDIDSPALQSESKNHIAADVRIVSAPAKDRYDKAAFWVNTALAAVGFLGIFAAFKTLRKLERQTAATEKSAIATEKAAEAALLNAQAVINAERALILIEIEKTRHKTLGGVAIFKINAVNYGRTPAQIISYGIPKEICTAAPDQLAIPPEYAEGPRPIDQFLAPGKSFQIGEFTPSSSRITALCLEATQLSGTDFKCQQRIVCGEVVYNDGISPDIRVSRYCLRHERQPFSNIGGSLAPCGPPAYTEHT